MAYRLGSGRVTLDLEDGPAVEVQPIVSDTVYRTAVALANAYFAAEGMAAVAAALKRVVTFFCAEAMPTWEIIDHHGAVPPTPVGMIRLPDVLALRMVLGWAEEFVAEAPSTAVDELIPPGPLRDQLNAQLRAVA